MYHQPPQVIPLSSLVGGMNYPNTCMPQYPMYNIPQMPMQMPQMPFSPSGMTNFHHPSVVHNWQPKIPTHTNRVPAITNYDSIGNYSSIMDAVTNSNAQIGECVTINGLTYVIKKTGEDGYAIRV